MANKMELNEMKILADLVMDELHSNPVDSPEDYENLLEMAIEGTGYTIEQFGVICDRRWNGPRRCS